jgi:hypothetical protein
MNGWICANGHANEDGFLLCQFPRCSAKKERGIHPISLVSWILALFTALVYPFAGGFAIAAFAATAELGRLLGFPELLRIVVMTVTTLAGFFIGFQIERNASRFRAYRIVWQECLPFVPRVLVVQTTRTSLMYPACVERWLFRATR